jgi:RimJ/RimL family protein N-acetyltransferase
MVHSIQAEGYGVRLRPVRMEDAAFIVWLRHSDHAQGNIGDTAANVASQEAWLTAYFMREGDYYFIIETAGGIPVGTYGIYNVRGDGAEQGRFVIDSTVRAAVPAAVVSLDMAFFQLGFHELRGATVATNLPVLSFYRKLGFREVGVTTAGQFIGGKPVDLVCFVVTVDDWTRARQPLLPVAKLAETQVREWEQAQLQQRSGSRSNPIPT